MSIKVGANVLAFEKSGYLMQGLHGQILNLNWKYKLFTKSQIYSVLLGSMRHIVAYYGGLS
jgi:hypothetical protein